MKKSLLILPLVAALTACTADDPARNGDNSPKDVSYISIRLANNVKTRADETPADAGDAQNYEDGLQTENAVNTVRFYFFDAAGNAATVGTNTSSEEISYVDVTSGFNDGPAENPNVEKTITATAPVQTDGVNFPSQIVAVVNPTSALNATKYNQLSLTELYQNIVEDFGTTNGFVMSNAVYAAGQKTVQAVPVSVNNFYTTPAAALSNPVTIHVERVLAKVALTSALSAAGTVTEGGNTLNIYPTTDKEGNPYKFDNNQIYVKFLGWNVTCSAASSYLMKNINPLWDDNLFGADDDGVYEPWNWPSYFRSFWAINPSNLTFNYFDFGVTLPNADQQTSATADGAKGAAGVKGFLPTGNDTSKPANFTYLQENAASGTSGAGAEQPSQVIVAAQLCQEDGTPIELAEWAFRNYTISGLKTALVNALASKKFFKTIDGQTTALSPEDITFATAGSLNENIMTPNASGRYYVYAVLTPEAEAATWTTDETTEDAATTFQAVNKALYDLGHAKIWNNGYTYYYFDIRHLGANSTDPGYFGVVRNHVYQATINNLTGLGTPVYDPTEKIYPEQPEGEDTFIAAVIKILSWRIVTQGVSFAW